MNPTSKRPGDQDKPKCCHCKHWHCAGFAPCIEGAEVYYRKLDLDFGLCRAGLPVPMRHTENADHLETFRNAAVWPVTHEHDWCGAFVAEDREGVS